MHAPAKNSIRPAGNSAGRALNPRRRAGNGRILCGRSHWVSASGSTPAPGVAVRALAVGRSRRTLSRTVGGCPCARVFRVGAENCARGGRAPLTLPHTGCCRLGGNCLNSSGNFLKASDNCPKDSDNFQEAPANCPRASASFQDGRDNFPKG